MIEPAHSTRGFQLDVLERKVPTPCDIVGSGPAALLLPALSSISARAEMRPLAKILGHDYRCLIPDWPGFGNHPRSRIAMEPETFHAFMDSLLAALPGPYAIGIAAGHAGPYLVAAARRHPGVFDRLVLIAPTWRGPLPTALGDSRRGWLSGIRKAIELPLLGEALYRINISPPIIGRMMRAHVYADPDHVTPGIIADKHAVTLQPGGRFGTAAFVTGGLDPFKVRKDFLALIEAAGLPPILVLRPERAPRRSGAEMDALIAAGHVAKASVPGALSPHEEYPGEVAAAILAGIR
ncbi:alpha/beta hydrolase [Methylobacterium sp. WL19]|uniref:alpha/beta fold hydrolase n=1 Tax=Methylobacterium sp. WL19 TaxID=2603896 RepID=UPI0011CBBDC8|nr:alpha/beta hydrolase [Methylobacterium sp. WL19]TXN28694.1 alpha/beta hydrolase [Methylobacterium sp. WL19]